MLFGVCACVRLYVCACIDISGLMIMASHQTFSSQIKRLSGQIKFGQTNSLYNGEVTEFVIDDECPDNFHSLS